MCVDLLRSPSRARPIRLHGGCPVNYFRDEDEFQSVCCSAYQKLTQVPLPLFIWASREVPWPWNG